ncbi:hypothetical protein BS329_15210 [Amycolatopsis coloradensis]|uniref:Lipoprotein n=1 Tax=Amycolatopsis coloradensis TaxID=76021 RepID=A0A1R0KUC8_9PSEU|nr:hypothetical protein [Amycolatopsis coloradensis]OLZ51616.1 hypothetical protein BS329_15210 [Amycolatopsis coloradensis]
MNRRRTGMVTTIAVVALGAVACGGQNVISEGNVAEVRQALATAVSGAAAVTLDPSGDGFTQSYRLRLRFTSPAVTAEDARAAARRAAPVVWDTADTRWTTLWVETGCARAEACGNVQLTVDAAYAEAVWGAPAHGAHRPAIDDEDRRRAAAASHNATSTGVFDFARETPSPFPAGWHVYGPKPKQGSDFAWLDVYVPAGTDQRRRESGLAQIAAVLWHDQPGNLRGVGLDGTEIATTPPSTATVPGTAAAPRATYRYERDAAELRRTFGPRAADLETP